MNDECLNEVSRSDTPGAAASLVVGVFHFTVLDEVVGRWGLISTVRQVDDAPLTHTSMTSIPMHGTRCRRKNSPIPESEAFPRTLVKHTR